MKVKPLGDRVLVKRIQEEEKTKGGIIIPETAKEKPKRAGSWPLAAAKPLRMASWCRSK